MVVCTQASINEIRIKHELNTFTTLVLISMLFDIDN